VACETLQKEGEFLKSSELSKVLEMLAGILRKYDEAIFRNFPPATKRQVVYTMEVSLKRSLGFTDNFIALMQQHQRESEQKGKGTMGDPQQYHKVSQCIANLKLTASQFDRLVITLRLASKIAVADLSHPVLLLYLIQKLSLGHTKISNPRHPPCRDSPLLQLYFNQPSRDNPLFRVSIQTWKT
jgi:hypothetical protein